MGKGFYHMSTEDRAAVLTAADATEVPIKLRNKLYAALGRLVKGDPKKISADFIAKWATAEHEGNESKFSFLQAWAQDTSGAAVLMSDKFSKSVVETDEVAFAWVTKFDLYASKNAYAHPLQMAFCDKLLAAAKTRAHNDPKHRKDSTQIQNQATATETKMLQIRINTTLK